MLVKKYIRAVLCLSMPFILFSNSRYMMQAVKNGLFICYDSVIPSLYIFMVFSNYIGQSDILPLLSVPLMWYGRLLKIEDKRYSAYVLLSLAGGFAVGANFLNKLIKEGYPQKALNTIAITMINNSFSFCCFAVGTGWLGSRWLGVMLFTALTAASLITAFLWSFIEPYDIVMADKKEENTSNGIVNSINSAVQNMVAICGFVIISYCICEVISLYANNNDFRAVISAVIMEVTSGCLKIIGIYGKNLYFICFCLSILPLSTLCQVYYFTANKQIIKTLLISRIIHTPVSLLIFSLLINFFPVAAAVNADVVITVKAWQSSAEISSVLFLITIIFLIIFDENRIFTKSTE